jgi:hypothetical protein
MVIRTFVVALAMVGCGGAESALDVDQNSEAIVEAAAPGNRFPAGSFSLADQNDKPIAGLFYSVTFSKKKPSDTNGTYTGFVPLLRNARAAESGTWREFHPRLVHIHPGEGTTVEDVVILTPTGPNAKLREANYEFKGGKLTLIVEGGAKNVYSLNEGGLPRGRLPVNPGNGTRGRLPVNPPRR